MLVIVSEAPTEGQRADPAGITSQTRENVLTTASAMQRRDGRLSRFMTSTLAVALAVSTLIAPSTLARGPHDCCRRAGAMPRHTSLQCCMPDRPEQTPRQAPPQGPTTPAPELLPLLPVAAVIPPLVVRVALATGPGRMAPFQPLYLLHATLLV
jgi:hypothetical protein